MRFEVFKRDNFTCQYCGRHAPDVILECDHIKPVADGGKNTMLNLVTSCVDCNRGKGKRRLNDTTEVDKQFNELSSLAQKREQMQMLIKWRDELKRFEDEQIEVIEELMCDGKYYFTDHAKRKVKMLIKKYGFDEVLVSAEIAYDKYIHMGVSYAVDKIGGVCYNRAHKIGADKYGC